MYQLEPSLVMTNCQLKNLIEELRASISNVEKKWGPQHKCPPNVSLHAMEELWKCVTEGEELVFSSVEED